MDPGPTFSSGDSCAPCTDQDMCARRGATDVKFTVERDVLAEAVTWTARSLPSRPSIPVLAGVRLEASTSGTLALSSFDYEVSAVSQISADVAEAGTVLVSGRLLAEISRSLPNKPVEVVIEGTRAVLTCGSSRFTPRFRQTSPPHWPDSSCRNRLRKSRLPVDSPPSLLPKIGCSSQPAAA